MMDHGRIAELLEPFLGPENPTANKPHLVRNISTYIDLLLRWNARINLTAIRDPEQIVTRHFGESLFAALHLFPDPSSPSLSSRPECVGERSEPAHAVEGPWVRLPAHWNSKLPDTDSPAPAQSVAKNLQRTTTGRLSLADVGSGPGFPGIPIKLWAPDISLTLIESNHKKATFLREVTRALTLTDVNIQTARAESLAAGSFNVVTLRAVERFREILPASAALIRPQGHLALLIGKAQLDQARSTLPTLEWSDPVPIPQSNSRILLIARQM